MAYIWLWEVSSEIVVKEESADGVLGKAIFEKCRVVFKNTLSPLKPTPRVNNAPTSSFQLISTIQPVILFSCARREEGNAISAILTTISTPPPLPNFPILLCPMRVCPPRS